MNNVRWNSFELEDVRMKNVSWNSFKLEDVEHGDLTDESENVDIKVKGKRVLLSFPFKQFQVCWKWHRKVNKR